MEAVQPLSEYEIERGKPMPSKNHALAQFHLTAAFARYADQYTILPELSLDIGPRPYTPDISIYTKLPTDWQHDEIKMTEPPLMAVEILSPTQGMDEIMRKADAYFEAGVKSCWIVQPFIETIIVFQPGERRKVFASGKVEDPATGITVTVEQIFPCTA